jgi:hypothetical protein
MNWIYLALVRVQWWVLVNLIMNVRFQVLTAALSTDVSEVRTASIIRDDNSELDNEPLGFIKGGKFI